MKKWFASAVLFVIALLIAVPAQAANPLTKVSLSSSSVLVKKGDSFQVTVRAENAVHLAGVSLKLRYDTQKLRLAVNALGNPLVTPGADFSHVGGGTVNPETGEIAYPLLYGKPLSNDPVNVPVMTVTFISLAEGNTALFLENIRVLNYLNLESQENTTASQTVVTGPTLTPPPGETKFSIRSTLSYLKEPGAVLDFDGNGVVDKADIAYVLRYIEPMALSPSL